MLTNEVNYIVSGLERSGTSVMMQLLHAGGVPVAFDNSRPADNHNPRGYFELAGGKIINLLMDGKFDFNSRKGQVVKITAYGLKFLPPGNYKIIYMLRDLDEVLKSMQKMGAQVDRDKDWQLYNKLNRSCFDLMGKRNDIKFISVDYHEVLKEPEKVVQEINAFFEIQMQANAAIQAVDSNLYRNRADG